ncbi:hypothetical protein HS1genome_2155 [Sulfodiicoccus acidiphilus]|uniref:NurA domain-containing protein n=1 Tax=Sulfodiicoccus acidiphilus TaxID=1670455 RepID=A0A348B6G4_9CREN|nr:DNA double-strand break repair nuclease NurA [Sulfodiicoccus acidiphilus]BBD73766.1 hypothetical protein HS1genome_2155 [Sulfodiicoccus acidiphilus]GGT98191.1 hypothetical protein GCM10007116_14710 [Sulfodiicoccus acidiphilus]
MDSSDLLALIRDDLARYLTDVGRGEDFEANDGSLVNSLTASLMEPQPRELGSVTAVDGSSRSLTYSYGVVSLASVAAASNKRPVVGIYPTFLGSPSLPLRAPFIAVASSSPKRGEGIERYLSPYMDRTPSGKVLDSLAEPEVVESLLRASLESVALGVVNDQLVLVDGPLLPSYVRLPEEDRSLINRTRLRYLDSKKVGVVKRLEKSTVLRSALSGVREETIRVMGLDPTKFASDQALLLHWARFCLQPPYSTTVVGPVEREEYGTKVYSYYLLRPYHPFVPRFSLLRVESLIPSKDPVDIVAAMPLTGDGVPSVLALADRVAKAVSLHLERHVTSTLEETGLQLSYSSALEVRVP